MDLVGHVVDGKYEILGIVGEGGMGTVYEALHKLLRRHVAIKFMHVHLTLHRSSIPRFLREARIAGSLRHEHIVEVLDVGKTAQGVPYLVMEFLQGRDLRHLLRDEQAVAPARAAQIVVQVLAAIEAAHQAGVVHRDLKPENIFLSNQPGQNDWVKLLDFGVAKLLRAGSGEIEALTGNWVPGTLQYMSPEQAVGGSEVSPRSDIYSVGVILYELLTGKLPFTARKPRALLAEILEGRPTALAELVPDLPSELSDCVRRAMDQEPQRRFASAAEFRERLLPFAENRAPTYHPAAEIAYDAVFLGISPSTPISSAENRPLRVFHVDDDNGLLRALERFTPRVIVTSMALDFEAIAKQFPIFRISLILLSVKKAGAELMIREWNPEHNAFVVTRAALDELDGELARLAKQSKSTCISHATLATIGANYTVELDGAAFHVQTEVLAGNSIQVSTTVWRAGAFIDRACQPFKPTAEDVFSELSEFALTQHAVYVEKVQNREYAGGKAGQ